MSNDAFVPHPDRLLPADPAVREALQASGDDDEAGQR